MANCGGFDRKAKFEIGDRVNIVEDGVFGLTVIKRKFEPADTLMFLGGSQAYRTTKDGFFYLFDDGIKCWMPEKYITRWQPPQNEPCQAEFLADFKRMIGMEVEA